MRDIIIRQYIFDFTSIKSETVDLLKKVYDFRYSSKKHEFKRELDLINDCILINQTVLESDTLFSDLGVLYNLVRTQNHFIGLFSFLQQLK